MRWHKQEIQTWLLVHISGPEFYFIFFQNALVFLSRLTGINLSLTCLIVTLAGGKITLTFTPDRLKKGKYGRVEG